MMLVLVPIVLQGIAMAVDEGVFHRRRGLPRWERIGHPLDTATIAMCLVWLLAVHSPAGYVVLAIGSTLFVTKDEAVHATLCTAGEHWLHAVLFALHPVVLAAFWFASPAVLAVQLALVLAFMAYQIIYWRVRRDHVIDNAWYGELGARWYEARTRRSHSCVQRRAIATHGSAGRSHARSRGRHACSISAAAPGFSRTSSRRAVTASPASIRHRRTSTSRARTIARAASTTCEAMPARCRSQPAASTWCARWTCSSTSTIPSA